VNIFELHTDPFVSARMHCDKHVVKMPIEYAQMLSTAHRVLDGIQYVGRTETGRRVKRWKLNDIREKHLYKAGHVKHPDTIWVMQSKSNYYHLFFLYMATLKEYTHRYGKTHGASKPSFWLQKTPNNIPDIGLTELPQCMPDDCKTDDVVEAYHNYYRKYKTDFATWKKRETPEWYVIN
tara:strand:+ start:1334 stop:1870 length:537 start_codon:yes stop_codon:yes gene_type:complete